MQPTDSQQLRDSVHIVKEDVAGRISADLVFPILDQVHLLHAGLDVEGVELELEGDDVLWPAEMGDVERVSEPCFGDWCVFGYFHEPTDCARGAREAGAVAAAEHGDRMKGCWISGQSRYNAGQKYKRRMETSRSMFARVVDEGERVRGNAEGEEEGGGRAL